MSTWLERSRAKEALRESQRKLLDVNTRLEQQVTERTEELRQAKDFLQTIIDTSLEMIQVFKAIRDENGKIIDFQWILNNKTSETLYGDIGGQTLLENNPGVIEEGIFDSFVQVTETGIPQQYEKHYVHEQFDGWFFQSVVKFDDGVATATADISKRKQAEIEILSLNRELVKKNRELKALNSELQTFTNVAANDYQDTLHKFYVGFEQIVKQDAAKLSDSSKASIRRIQSGIQKLKLLTEDIIGFSRLSTIDPNKMTVDLNEIASTVIADFADDIVEKSTAFKTDDLPQIVGYPYSFR